MFKILSNTKWLFIALLIATLMISCGTDRSTRNLEYAPNMYNSLPLEPYSQTEYLGKELSGTFIDNGDKTDEEVLKEIGFAYGASAQKPPEGTVPRGNNTYYNLEKEMPWSPYPFPNNNQGYEAAGVE